VASTAGGTQNGLNADPDPKTYTEEESRIVDENLNSIMLALNVIACMYEWPRVRILCE
jgi:hypothetical protein